MATDRRRRWQAASRNHTGAPASLRGARHEHTTTTGTLGLPFLTVAGWLRRWLEDVPLTQADPCNSEPRQRRAPRTRSSATHRDRYSLHSND